MIVIREYYFIFFIVMDEVSIYYYNIDLFGIEKGCYMFGYGNRVIIYYC